MKATYTNIYFINMSLIGKVITITGAASGMGLDTARLFASKGAKLSLADIQKGPLKDIEAELQKSGTEVMSQVVDVSKRDQVDSWIAATVEKFGQLDGCANIAGVMQRKVSLLENIDDDTWNSVLGINTYGVMACMRAQIPHLKDGGAIVNASSVLGLQGSPGCAAYVASKHAVVGLTRAAAKELGKRNIRVNCFCPYVSPKTLELCGLETLLRLNSGMVETPMLRAAAESAGTNAMNASFLPLGRAAKSEEVPPLCEFLISDASSYITGAAISIDGGWHC